VSALANEEVGNYLNRHFVSSFQKVGTFRVSGAEKQGGNVACYFCTPKGQVLHLIAGPVDATSFLREARWVMETWKMSELASSDDPALLQTIWAKAHVERLRYEHATALTPNVLVSAGTTEADMAAFLSATKILPTGARVHLLLSNYPMVKLERIFAAIFENVLGEGVSTRPVVEVANPALPLVRPAGRIGGVNR
jgi:hypothetical protein